MNAIRTRDGRFPRKDLDPRTLRELWLAGVGCVEIGRRLGVSKSLVSKTAMRIGLPRRIGFESEIGEGNQ